VTEPTYRARCVCGHRFETETAEGGLVACAACHAVRPAEAEPVDDVWWAWWIVQPLNRRMMHLPPVHSPTPTAPVKAAPPAPKRTRLPEGVRRAF
jgi:hypothetical protein